jgi:hypothetical protein
VYIKTSIDQCLPPASQDYIIKACPQTEVVEIQADHFLCCACGGLPAPSLLPHV